MSSLDILSNGALQYGLSGYQAGSESLSRSAAGIADSASGRSGRGQSVSINSASVELITGALQAKASIKVIEGEVSQYGVLGSIIDTYA